MRIVCMDESGSSASEPYVVVAGVIVHADKQWRGVEKYLADMVEEYIPPDQREGFCFHATELFHGTKRFHRDKWSLERRLQILDELVSIPEKFDFPIALGFVPKGKLRQKYDRETQASIDLAGLTIAFTVAAVTANEYMKRAAEADEVASIMVENNDQARALIKSQHDFIRNPARVAQLPEGVRQHLPLDRIVDTISFREKPDASPLQIADVCAFAIMRRLRQAPHSDRLYKPLEPFLIRKPNLEQLDKITPGEWPSEYNMPGEDDDDAADENRAAE